MYIAQVDAFSSLPFKGNPAGVVILDKDISSDIMLKIALEMNLSETAFIKKIHNSSDMFEIRFFTITGEIDMCGHATIASLKVIIGKYDVPTSFSVRTKSGSIHISVDSDKDGDIFLIRQPNGKNKGVNVSRETLSELMNLPMECFENDLSEKAVIYSTGLYDMLVPIKSKSDLNRILMDKNLMIKNSSENEITGYHCYAIENQTIYVRNFAPLVGIDEESATGTSNGALLAYLYENKKIEKGDYVIVQGEQMGNPTTIFGKIDDHHIWVGGYAYLLFEGELFI